MVTTPLVNNGQTLAVRGIGNPTDDQAADLNWAVQEIMKRRDAVKLYREYYDGKQRSVIRDDRLNTVFAKLFRKFKFNLCPTPVDALADRLQIASFSSPEIKQKRLEALKAARSNQLQQQTAAMEARLRASQQVAQEETQEKPQPGGSTTNTGRTAANASASTPNPTPGEQNRQAQQNGQDPSAGDDKPPTPPVLPQAVTFETPELPKDDAGAIAQEIWDLNSMDRRAGHVHTEAIASGDAYVIVWRDAEGAVRLYPQGCHEVVVEYDKEKPGTLKKAAKVWTEDITRNGEKKKALRVNLYYPDRIEKWAVEKASKDSIPKGKDFFKNPEEGEMLWPIPNPWQRVPVIHFANSADVNEYGKSELKDAVDIQDFVNKSLMDLLVGAEFMAYPQRYGINLETGTDDQGRAINPFKAGAENLWAFYARPSDEDEKYPPPQMGQFPAADLTQMLKVVALGARMMGQVTKTPSHYFEIIGDEAGGSPATPASGEAQKTADGKLTSKQNDREKAFGSSWKDCMELAVRMRQGETTLPEKVKLETEWEDTRPRSESEQITNAINKKKLKVSDRQLLKELGYTDEEIDSFEKENMLSFYAMQQTPGAVAGGGDINTLLDDLGIE